MTTFKTIKSNDFYLNKVQDNLKEYFNKLPGTFILDGILHKNILINTTYALAHGLGRLPLGYIVVKRDSGETVYNGDITNKTINLLSTGNVIVDIWVF